MLRFEPVAFHDDLDARYGAVIVTSANALRGLDASPCRQPAAEAAAVRGGRTYRRRRPRRRLRKRHRGQWRRHGAARADAGKRQGEGAEESQHAALSGGRRSGARSRRRTRRTRLLRRHPHHLPDDSGHQPAARGRAMPSPPTRSRRCCIIRGAARAPSWKRRGPPASKYRRWRSRNAAFPPPWPPSSATPGPPRSRSRRRRMKMPCSRRWTVRCGRYRARKRFGRPARAGKRAKTND